MKIIYLWVNDYLKYKDEIDEQLLAEGFIPYKDTITMCCKEDILEMWKNENKLF